MDAPLNDCSFVFFFLVADGCVAVIIQNIEENTAEYTARFANPMVGAQRGFIDDIIEPEMTRKIICDDLRILKTKNLDNIPRRHSNIPL